MPTVKQKTPENESEAIPGLFGMEARGSGSQACCTARLPPHGMCRSIAAASPASDGGAGSGLRRGAIQCREAPCRVWHGFAVACRGDEWSLGGVSLPGCTMDL